MNLKSFRRFSLILFTISFVLSLNACSHAPKVDAERSLASMRGAPKSKTSETGAQTGLFNNPDFNGKKLGLVPITGEDIPSSPVVAVIQKATKTLDIEIYMITDFDVRKAIRSALQRNVRVRLIKEPAAIGEGCPYFYPIRGEKDKITGYRLAGVEEPIPPPKKRRNAPGKPVDQDCVDQRQMLQEIVLGGGTVVEFKKPELCGKGGTNCVEHGKMVISDERYVLLSSGNFNSSNLCNLKPSPISGKVTQKCNRDYSYILDAKQSNADADSVRLLKTVFENDLQQKNYDLYGILKASPAQERITVSPYSMDPLLEFIRSAKKSVIVQNQYIKDPTLQETLLEVAKRGIKVELSLASLCSFGKPKANAAKKAAEVFGAFDNAGILSTFFTAQNRINGKTGYMHAKAILVDGERAWMGSVNGSTQALTDNREFGIFFDEPQSVQALRRVLEKDLSQPGNETWQESLQCKKDKSPPAESSDDSSDEPTNDE